MYYSRKQIVTSRLGTALKTGLFLVYSASPSTKKEDRQINLDDIGFMYDVTEVMVTINIAP
ncbi:MAG: hypothetical protein ACRC37_05200 [Lentisphaeria bacterium]